MKSIFLMATLLMSCILGAQSLDKVNQVVRGTVVDVDTKFPLMGASVVVLDSEPFKGTITDLDGKFRLEEIPLGRVQLKVSYLGYEDQIIPQIQVTSAKEIVLEIQMQESFMNLGDVVIKAEKKKENNINEMVLSSGRQFSVEETNKYAGSFNDPARAASSFAGVVPSAAGSNDIVIRGNSSKGVLWRLEGMEIPNPNHFSEDGSSGGNISGLNSDLLSNSDFLTGAFPAEYGNAMSGVFDIQLRKGNNEKREYAFGLGALGVDMTMEGPFKKGYDGSYLINYRYSTLDALVSLGLFEWGGVPKYQDATFNLSFPTKKFGQFSVYGLGGLNKIEVTGYTSPTEDTISFKGNYTGNFGVVGIKNNYLIDSKRYWQNALSLATQGKGDNDQLALEDGTFKDNWRNNLIKNNLRYTSTYNHKFDARNTLKVGLISTHSFYSLNNDYYLPDSNRYETRLNEKGNTQFLQGFVTYKKRWTDRLTMVGGLHSTYFKLNNEVTVEPRLALDWRLDEKQSLNGAIGLHSKLETPTLYLAERNGVQHNLDLEMQKGWHYVIGYNNKLTDNLNLKAEVYYQDLFDVPIDADTASLMSTLNTIEGITTRDLVNNGRGRNYGVELTLERYLQKGYYYLVTGSLFESDYKVHDAVWRPTQFSNRFAGNIVIGKEFKVGKKSNKVIDVNVKSVYLGGGRITEIDLDESKGMGYTVRKWDEPFGKVLDNVFRMDLSISYLVNRPNTTHEIELEFINATFNKAVVGEYYNASTESIVFERQIPIVPNIMYKFHF